MRHLDPREAGDIAAFPAVQALAEVRGGAPGQRWVGWPSRTLNEDPDGAFHAEKVDLEGHHGFDRQRLDDHLVDAGFAEVSSVDTTTQCGPRMSAL